ncbi:hypothetical protein GF314_15965, partial [bacterium]|nr:hypothetical protein [bacterium]
MTSPTVLADRPRRRGGLPLLATLVLLVTLTPAAMAQQFDDATVLALELEGPDGIIR